MPADAFVIGEPISVIGFDYDGNERRGLTATCRREGVGDYVINLPEVEFPRGSEGARYVAAYRKWLGLEPLPDSGEPALRRSSRHRTGGGAHRERARPRRRHHATEDDLDLGGPVELIVLSVK